MGRPALQPRAASPAMRIAFVSTILDYPWGGADAMWTRAAVAASARGDTLLVAVTQAVAAHKAVAALNARFHIRAHPAVPRTLGARIAGKLRRLFRKDDALITEIIRFRPDWVVISLGGAYDLAASSRWTDWLSSTRIPFGLLVNFQRDEPALEPAEWERTRRVFTAAQRIYFVSTRNLEVTQKHLKLPLGNGEVVQYPLRWEPSDPPQWPGEAVYSMAVVARLEPIKGIHLLLPALAEALTSERGWRLRIHGKGPDKEALRRQADELGIGSKVEFMGFVGDLASIWSENHMLVSPALDEGVPLTLPEAMLCGRLVLATAVGGAKDWIVPGSNGFICPAPSVAALSESLRHAWGLRSAWREMGARAARDARARYRPDDYMKLIEPLD
jgi:glycosyltransferase involved in cell wall biosynthesis